MLKEINELKRTITEIYYSSKLKQVYDITFEDLDDYNIRSDYILGASTLPSFEEMVEEKDGEKASTMLLSELAFCKQWEKMRRTFVIDEDFVDVLADTKNTKMYLKVFESIKYPCFAFELDSKILEYEEGSVRGFVVDIQFFDITEDVAADAIKYGYKLNGAGEYLGFSLMTVFEDDNGGVAAAPVSLMLNYNDLKKDEYGKYFLLDDIWANISSGNVVSPVGIDLSLCLAYYLCSKEPDIVEKKAVIAQKQKIDKITNPKLKKKKMKEFEYKSEVGTRVGNAIRLNATESSTEKTQAGNEKKSSVSGKTRKMVTPHVRGAHWSHRWHGSKDNRKLQPCFIAPTFVNPHLGEIDEVKQAVKV